MNEFEMLALIRDLEERVARLERERLAAAVAEERESCAKVALTDENCEGDYGDCHKEIAAAIRARGLAERPPVR